MGDGFPDRSRGGVAPCVSGPGWRSVSDGWATLGFMDVEPEEPVAPNVQATMSEAAARADAAWASLQERGSSFGTHPLSDLLEAAVAGADASRIGT